MMATAIKPKPGVYKGVSYRSQLEIKWAQWFESQCDDKWDLIYADQTDSDFITAYRGALSHWRYMEIKPCVYDLCRAAICRLDFLSKSPGEFWSLLIGQPPSAYGKPAVVQFHFIETSQIYGPYIELSAVVTAGIIDDCGWPPRPECTHEFDSFVIPGDLWAEYMDDGDSEDNWLSDALMRGIASECGTCVEWD